MEAISELFNQILQWFNIRSLFLMKAGFEVFLIFLLVYGFLRLLQGTRGVGIVKGLTVFLGVLLLVTILVTRWFPLETVNWVLTRLAPVVLVPLFILFQPEIRRALIRLGQNPLFSMFFRPHGHFTDELVEATFSLARNKIGGMIAIERQVGLSSYVERGVRLDSEVSAELIKTIFWPGTPLHDGAIVIRHQRIASAGCLFPLTDNPHFSTELGTRHRAGIGISEESDAVAIIVSEQTGQVSLAVKGAIQQDLDERALRRALEDIAAEPLVTE
ncbi:MAG: diadenylate cyclase CdaA [Planctomycetes bacterium]|nr:diadenylate cyclase CdaA [Planctomycetota bacterium]